MGLNAHHQLAGRGNPQGTTVHTPLASWRRYLAAALSLCAATTLSAQPVPLKNPGFEQGIAGWTVSADNEMPPIPSETEVHSGKSAMGIAANSAIEQHIENIKAGAYLARCWVKSDAAQMVSAILTDPARPWAVYNYAEIKVPAKQWTQIEVFCSVDRDGSLDFRVGGTSKDFRAYKGPEAEMRAPIVVDDFELIRSEPKTVPSLTLKEIKAAPSTTFPTDGRTVDISAASIKFTDTPFFQARHVAGTVRKSDGGLVLYATDGKSLKPRAVAIPSPALRVSELTQVTEGGRTGLRVTSDKASYTAWISPKGVIQIEAKGVSQFVVSESRMSYGILPSFIGADICYEPAKLTGTKTTIPSTQWFVGLLEGNDGMLVAAWEAPSQAVSLGLSGAGDKRVINSLTIDTSAAGFGLSLVEHAGIWHQEPLKEEYLGDYTAIAWERPFQARWMADFFASPGGKPSFNAPYNHFSFPFANAKTRMWGTWFEDWNHLPFYFDGGKTIVHFEKSFAPQGNALIYFLEPAAADLYSPTEIAQDILGAEKAAQLFAMDGNSLRKLKYSTPSLFMFDRPVCATTTRLSKIKQSEKPTVGVNLATHLYEFIREIRARVDQYATFFAETKTYLAAQKSAHPELADYLTPLESLVTESQSKTSKAYDTPIAAVETKIEAMKKLLEQGKGDGFDCGTLDVRGPAGTQDDLCRRFNRMVLRLQQTAALNCGDSPVKTAIAQELWNRSREILKEPTRWEARRTLYFCEP